MRVCCSDMDHPRGTLKVDSQGTVKGRRKDMELRPSSPTGPTIQADMRHSYLSEGQSGRAAGEMDSWKF